MSSPRLVVAEILTFKVTLSEQNQQNLHFGHFWAFLPPFWLKLLMFTYISIFHTCQSSRFTVMVVQSFKKCKFFNKNYCENFSKKLKKKFSSGFLSWENKIISNFLDPPFRDLFLKNFCSFFRLRFDWKICIFWNFGPP